MCGCFRLCAVLLLSTLARAVRDTTYRFIYKWVEWRQWPKFNGAFIVPIIVLEYAYTAYMHIVIITFFVVAPTAKCGCATASATAAAATQLHTSFKRSALVLVFTISNQIFHAYVTRKSVCVPCVLVHFFNGSRWKIGSHTFPRNLTKLHTLEWWFEWFNTFSTIQHAKPMNNYQWIISMQSDSFIDVVEFVLPFIIESKDAAFDAAISHTIDKLLSIAHQLPIIGNINHFLLSFFFYWVFIWILNVCNHIL